MNDETNLIIAVDKANNEMKNGNDALTPASEPNKFCVTANTELRSFIEHQKSNDQSKMIKNTTISKAPRSAAARKITKSKKATTTKRLKKSKSRNKRKQTKLFNSASTIYSWNELASLNQHNSNNTHLDYSSATNLDQSNNQQLLEDFNLLVNLVAYGLRSNQLNGLQANSDQFGNFHNYDQSNGMSWNGIGNGNGNCLTLQNQSQATPKGWYGKYRCFYCAITWTSAYAWPGKWQKCEACFCWNYPKDLTPLKARSENSGKKKTAAHKQNLCQMCIELKRHCGILRYWSVEDVRNRRI